VRRHYEGRQVVGRLDAGGLMRLEREKEDLEMWLGNCESDVIAATKDIENNKESNIDCNIRLHLEQIYQY